LVINECRDEKGTRGIGNMIHNLIEQRPEWGLNETQVGALTASFLMRFRDNIRREMDRQLHDVLRNRYQWSSSSQTIGLPIRGSDKCNVIKGRRVLGEMECLAMDEYPAIVSSLKADHPEINAVIVTSEDPAVLEWIKQNLTVPGVQRIYNDYDDVPGTGSPYARSHCEDDEQCVRTFLNIWMTVRLQMHAQYMVTNRFSNILHLIWAMTDSFDCQLDQNPHTELQHQCIDTSRGQWNHSDPRCARKDFMSRYS